MKFFTMIGLYGLDFSLNSTVRGSRGLDRVDVLPHRGEVHRRGLAELEGEDHVVGGEVGPVGPLGAILQRQHECVVIGLLELLGQTRDERAVEEVEAQQALIDELAWCVRALGQSGEAASGLKLFGGPHWKPATNIVSPAAPARPFACPVLLPVCAVPHAETPRPRAAPPRARPVRVRKCRRLGVHVVLQSAPLPAVCIDGSI